MVGTTADVFVRRAPEEAPASHAPAVPPVSPSLLKGKALTPAEIYFRQQMARTRDALHRMLHHLANGVHDDQISGCWRKACEDGAAAPMPRASEIGSVDKCGKIVLAIRLLEFPQLLERHSAVACSLIADDRSKHPAVPRSPGPAPAPASPPDEPKKPPRQLSAGPQTGMTPFA